MKNNLPYFSHDNDAHNHPKMKALRARYGWTGYGQFWALNEAVAAAPECRLDLGRKVVRAAVACELGLTPDGFEDFLTFLSDPDECGLIAYNAGIITTDRTQEDFARIEPIRQKARERWAKKATSHEVFKTSHEVPESSSEVLTDKIRVDKIREEEDKSKSVHSPEEMDSIFPDDPQPPKQKSGKAAPPIPETKHHPPQRFIKPKLEEVRTYCAERNNRVSPEKFLDHYEANGWRVGRTPMKDWRAAVRNWEKNEIAGGKNAHAATGRKDPWDEPGYYSAGGVRQARGI